MNTSCFKFTAFKFCSRFTFFHVQVPVIDVAMQNLWSFLVVELNKMSHRKLRPEAVVILFLVHVKQQ